MKHPALFLLMTLVLAGTVWAHNATTNDPPTLYIGRDQATGDEVMSIGPAQNHDANASVPDPLIIRPEIILPPKHHHRNQDDPRDFRPGSDGLRRPGTRQ